MKFVVKISFVTIKIYFCQLSIRDRYILIHFYEKVSASTIKIMIYLQ